MNAKRMAVYAGMLEYLDRDIGRMVDHLKAKSLLDNTVILVMSDNGGEGTELMDNFAEYYKQNFDLSYERMGERVTFSEYGPGWAAVSGTPLNGLKGTTMEGGTRAPLIVRYPAGVPAGSRASAYTYVQDIVPTILDMAGVSTAPTVAAKLDGRSLTKLMANGTAPYSPEDAVVTELAGNIMVYRGGYKLVRNLVPVGDGAWHLYNVARDPGEQHDLAAREPGRVRELRAVYEDYVKRNNLTEVPNDYNALRALAKNRQAPK
jgi:arylsulfatase A-like enzyme